MLVRHWRRSLLCILSLYISISHRHCYVVSFYRFKVPAFFTNAPASSHTHYFYPSYCTQRNTISTEHHNNQYILTIIKTGLIPRSTLILPSAVSPLDVSLWNYVPMSSPRLLKTFGAYVYFRYAYYISFLFFVCICEPFNICISQNSRVDTCSILYFDIIALFVLVRWLIRIVRKELVWCVYFRVLYLFQWSDTIWGRGDNTSWEDIDMHCCFNSHTHRLYQETPSHKECTFYISFFFYF